MISGAEGSASSEAFRQALYQHHYTFDAVLYLVTPVLPTVLALSLRRIFLQVLSKGFACAPSLADSTYTINP